MWPKQTPQPTRLVRKTQTKFSHSKTTIRNKTKNVYSVASPRSDFSCLQDLHSIGTVESRELWLGDQPIFIVKFTLSVSIFPSESCLLCGVTLGRRQERSPPAENKDAAPWMVRQGGLRSSASGAPLKREHVSMVRHCVPTHTLRACTHTGFQSCSLDSSLLQLGCTNQIPNIGLCFSNHCLKRREVTRRNDLYHGDGACYGIYKWHSQDE